ncbi:unnamed protein product [Symbiodinium pilosum]|uniref:Uncharacterized protein n=1 Tax=Symbiodinium pilosum TaxID=2952 RepID=A0A812M426_SYMPI|nr:unnamed protein product [Symbiodinium pilosum]
MEQIAISEGPASRPYAAELAVSWQQQRLLPLQKSLLLEIEKLSKDKAAAEAKALKLQAQLKASQDKAAKALENSAKLSKRAKQAAEKALHENSMYFHWKDLSKGSKDSVALLAKTGLGRCSRCRWVTKCLSCDAEHLFNNLYKKEASKKGKVPSLSGASGN